MSYSHIQKQNIILGHARLNHWQPASEWLQNHIVMHTTVISSELRMGHQFANTKRKQFCSINNYCIYKQETQKKKHAY